MERLSGAYFHTLSMEVEPLATITASSNGIDAYDKLYTAQRSLADLRAQA